MYTKSGVKSSLVISLLCLLFSAITVDLHAQNTLMYEISGGKAKKKSYLFGTLHMNQEALFQWNERVFQAIDQCDIAAFELDLQGGADPKKLMDHKRMKEWEDFAINDLLPAIEAAIPADSLVAKVLRFYEPILTHLVRFSKDSTNRQDFVDAYLQNYAAKRGKSIMGIETMKEQINLIFELDKEFIKKTIVEFLLLDDWTSAYMAMSLQQGDMIENYVNKDLDALCTRIAAHVNGTGSAELSKFYYQLFDVRNEIMFKRTTKMLKKKSMFIAVGAGHLCGPSGLIQRYRDAGYTVTPVDISSESTPSPIEWKTVKENGYSVDVPEDVDSIFLPSEDSWSFMFSESMVRTSFTARGKITFGVRVLEEIEWDAYHVAEDGVEDDEEYPDAEMTAEMAVTEAEMLMAEELGTGAESEGTDSMSDYFGDIEYSEEEGLSVLFPDSLTEEIPEGYFEQVKYHLKKEITPLMMESLVPSMRQQSDTSKIQIEGQELDLIFKTQFGRKSYSCTFPAVEEEEGGIVSPAVTLTMEGDPAILGSDEARRFFLSFKRLP